MKVAVACDRCGTEVLRDVSHVNRSRANGAPLYCSRECTAAARRTDTRTPEQKKADKAAYDAAYREKHREKRKRQCAEWFKRTYDPEKARVERKAKMPRHVEYCRQPEYRKWKSAYDKQYRYGRVYGEFAEAAMILVELEREIRKLVPDKYERLKMSGYIDRQIARQTARRRLRQCQK